MYKALTYTYALFQRLTRYHLDGRYRIDNNLIENDIRLLAIGRMGYLFCGTTMQLKLLINYRKLAAYLLSVKL
jgi:hypothetical protein